MKFAEPCAVVSERNKPFTDVIGPSMDERDEWPTGVGEDEPQALANANNMIARTREPVLRIYSPAVVGATDPSFPGTVELRLRQVCTASPMPSTQAAARSMHTNRLEVSHAADGPSADDKSFA